MTQIHLEGILAYYFPAVCLGFRRAALNVVIALVILSAHQLADRPHRKCQLPPVPCSIRVRY